MKKLIANVLDLFAPLYDSFFKLFMKDEAAFRKKVVEFAAIKKGNKILEVGCGTGALLIAVSKSLPGKTKVTGIDISPRLVRVGEKKTKPLPDDYELKVASALKLPFPNASFDIVFTCLVHHLLSDEESNIAILEIARVLKRNGKYISCEWKKFGFPKEALVKNRFRIEKTSHLKAKETVKVPLAKFDSVLISAKKV